jgi:enoyl-CoA hydratase/carnithine racemase
LRELFGGGPAETDHFEAYLDQFQALVRAIAHCERPIIGMMDGAAVGFGADLAFACDLRVAARTAYAQEKFVDIGLMPDGGGTFWLPRLVGTARAMKMILLAERVSAEHMLELGIVAQVVDSGVLLPETLALARRLERGPPQAFAAVKRTVHGSWGNVDEALLRERVEQLRLLRTHDVREGIAAWSDKREPTFKGT